MIMHFDACVHTAVDIMRERNPATSSKHRGANLALEVLTVESMLQLGVVADACENVVRFIRCLDKACFDILALPRRIQALKESALDLFARGGCVQHSGYTQRTLALIRKPRLVLLTVDRRPAADARGHELTNQKHVTTCLRRMANWWQLGEAILDT